MPRFVNTRASQRLVVSVHTGGLGLFGGEGAQRLSHSWCWLCGSAAVPQHVQQWLPWGCRALWHGQPVLELGPAVCASPGLGLP